MLLFWSSQGYKIYIRGSASVPGEAKIAFTHRMGVPTNRRDWEGSLVLSK